MSEPGFTDHLRSEKLRTQDARTSLVEKKLAYATALLGIGSLGLTLGQTGIAGLFSLDLLLYLVPWVGIAFDLYILGEDYSVKRIGAFLSNNTTDPLEKKWEIWVAKKRDPFAPAAMPVLTFLILGVAAFMLRLSGSASGPLFWTWFGATAIVILGLFGYYGQLRKQALAGTETTTMPPALLDTVGELRAEVRRAGYVLSDPAFAEIARLFTLCSSDGSLLNALKQLAPEYSIQEFLLCVDTAGRPIYPEKSLLEDFRGLAKTSPELKQWLQEAMYQEQNQPVILVARWLCHFAGLRHRVIHLFIDPPGAPDRMLIQVRSTAKAESPGCFDLPVAGHVDGIHDLAETILKELQEELHLSKDGIDDLRLIGSYKYAEPVSNAASLNVEWRGVFRCRLKSEAWDAIRLADDEVAALGIFSQSEVQSLITEYPERVASGLAKSFSRYDASK